MSQCLCPSYCYYPENLVETQTLSPWMPKTRLLMDGCRWLDSLLQSEKYRSYFCKVGITSICLCLKKEKTNNISALILELFFSNDQMSSKNRQAMVFQRQNICWMFTSQGRVCCLMYSLFLLMLDNCTILFPNSVYVCGTATLNLPFQVVQQSVVR